MQDRDWYNKLPIKEINELIKSTGWDVRRIYAALSIQERELEVKKEKAWSVMRNHHWDDQEYKDLLPVYEELDKKIENVGSE